LGYTPDANHIEEAATMKLDVRDRLWLVVAVVLLSLLGWEWFRANSIAKEIRKLRAAEQPLQFNNAYLNEAEYFVYHKFGERSKTDWESLKPLGINGRTLVTKSIKVTTGKQAYEELFGPEVEVVEDVESSQVFGRPVYIIRAKQSPPSK
jgi:hypothetical protein